MYEDVDAALVDAVGAEPTVEHADDAEPFDRQRVADVVLGRH